MRLSLLRTASTVLALTLATVASAVLETPVASVPARIAANGDTVAPGTGRLQVSLRLGSPQCVLPDGSWVYHGYQAQVGRDLTVAGSLLVRFIDGRVSSLHVADHATVQALRRSRHPAPDRIVAGVPARR